MKVLLSEGYELGFTEYGYSEIIRNKELHDHCVWTKEFIKKHKDEKWFRFDPIVIKSVESMPGSILRDYRIEDVVLPEGVTIDDERLVIEEYEPFEFSEVLYLKLGGFD